LARSFFLAAALSLTSLAFAQAPAAERFEIPALRADLALNEFARQAHLLVLFPYEEVARVSANALSGTYSVQEGVAILLRNTGLSASVDEAGRQLVVRVFRGETSTAVKAVDAGMEEVTVTGSRIRDTGMNTPVPVTVVTAEQVDLAAPGNLIDAFNRMPQFLGNSAPGTDVFIGTNAGQSVLNMRGLGANRTLVLLDGRRVVPSTKQGTLDINLLPESMIKRVEVVTGGASAAYGTDAVAGVTNFILDTDFTGFKGHVQGGETTRSDGGTREASFSYGARIGERAHLIASVDYYDADAIETYRGRNWMQDWGTVTNPAYNPITNASVPQFLVLPHVTSTLYTFGGLINQPGSKLDRLMFRPDGTAAPFVLGSPYALGGTQSQSGGMGDNIERDRASDAGLIPNVERYNGFAHLKVTLNDDWEAFGQILLGRNQVDGNGFADVMHSTWQGTIYRDNAYLPESLRQIMLDEGLQSFGFSRMGSSADLSVSRLVQANRTDSYTLGLKGSFGDWRVNTYYQYGRNQGELRVEHFPRTDHLFLALDAVVDPATGAITCRRNLFAPNTGCVPIDLFGAGRATPAAIAYVTEGVKTARTLNQQNALELSVDGEVLPSWKPGPISLAYGVAYRRDQLSQRVDDPSNPTNGPTFVAVPLNDPTAGIQGIPLGFAGVNSGVQFSIIPNFSGSITVKEAFAETLVPLLKDVAGAKQLNLSAAARYANYTGSGGIWSWKAGLDWQAIDSVRLRGTLSRDVRAANMSERFDSSGGGTSVQDPLFDNETVTFTQIIGGNPNVAPEKADTLTFGVVLQPAFVRELSLSVDWYSIDVKGSIGQLGSQQIVTACFQGAKHLCDQLTRDRLTNQIIGLQNIFLNINAAKVSGTDLEIDYTAPVGSGRSLGFRLLGSYLGENSITNLGVAKQDRAGETGALSFPTYQAVASAIYSQGPFKLFLSERYIGSGKRRYNDNEPGGVTIDIDRVSPAYYTDLQASYRFDLRNKSAVDVFANFTNLFDRAPPLAPNHTPFTGSVQTNAALFDVLGRRFVVGARFNF